MWQALYHLQIVLVSLSLLLRKEENPYWSSFFPLFFWGGGWFGLDKRGGLGWLNFMIFVGQYVYLLFMESEQKRFFSCLLALGSCRD